MNYGWHSSSFTFWHQLTGKTPNDWEGLKATSIQNLSIRYLRHILATTSFGRENTGNVNSKDLLLIRFALSAIKVNPTSFLLAHLSSISGRIRGPIYVGGLITSISIALDLHYELATIENLFTFFPDLDYCHNMRLIKN